MASPQPRLAAEDARHAREAALNEAQRLAQIGSWTWLAATDVVTWSDEMFRIYGRDPRTTAPSFAEQAPMYEPACWHEIQDAAARMLETGEPCELEIQIIRPDGGRPWCIARAAATTRGRSCACTERCRT